MKRHETQPVVGPFQRKTAKLIRRLAAHDPLDAQMAVTDLQHEIGFVLRLNQWPEESWQHRQLSELIAELETALAARLAPPPDAVEPWNEKPSTVYRRRATENYRRASSGGWFDKAIMFVLLLLTGTAFSISPIAGLAVIVLLVLPAFLISWACS